MFWLDHGSLNVERNFQPHRPRATGYSRVERSFQVIRNSFRLIDQDGVLRDPFHQCGQREFLYPGCRTPESPTRSERFTCPEITIIGVESSHAPATPVIALVPPGPDVTRTGPIEQKSS